MLNHHVLDLMLAKGRLYMGIDDSDYKTELLSVFFSYPCILPFEYFIDILGSIIGYFPQRNVFASFLPKCCT